MGNQLNMDEYLVAPFWGNTYIILLFICPGLTMRLFAEDVKSRSMELLLTSPVSTMVSFSIRSRFAQSEGWNPEMALLSVNCILGV